MAAPLIHNLPSISQLPDLPLGPALFGGSLPTLYAIIVPAGEDIITKILSFSLQELYGICVFSAIGSISQATIRQPGSSGAVLTYEGRYDIISMSGSLIPFHDVLENSRSGGINVSFVGPDGRFLGGGLAGLLIAATPVQVVLGTFFHIHLHPEGGGENDDVEVEKMLDKNEIEKKVDENEVEVEKKIDENKVEDNDEKQGSNTSILKFQG